MVLTELSLLLRVRAVWGFSCYTFETSVLGRMCCALVLRDSACAASSVSESM